MSTTSQRIDAHIVRLRPGRPGICDWAQREVLRLGAKLQAAKTLLEGEWRDLNVRAVDHQLLALEAELARLQTAVISPRVVPGGAA